MTTSRDDPALRKIIEDGPRKGQQEDYLVLSDEERAKGFVRPVRRTYRHIACGCDTTMGQALAETYASNPKFYGGTFCCNCGTHFDLGPPWNPNFTWVDDGEPVGSNAEEAAEWNRKKRLASIPAERERRQQRIDAAKRELHAALHSPEWTIATCRECSEEYPVDLQEKQCDAVFCQKCRLAKTTTKHSAEIDKLLAELPAHRRCTKCESPLIHSRLNGYQCPRGCQQ